MRTQSSFLFFGINMQTSQLIFISILLLLYLFFNSCRRLFVSAAPLLLQDGLLNRSQYGYISSISSILFGITRFSAFYLMEWFSMDIYVTVVSTIICCICVVLSIFPSIQLPVSTNVLLSMSFILLQAALGLPFSCSSVVIRTYIDPKCRSLLFLHHIVDHSLLWSILAVTSNIGSIVSNSLMYHMKSLPAVAGLLTRFGMACIVGFYVAFPTTKNKTSQETKEEKEENSFSTPSSTDSTKTWKKELLCLTLCYITQFLVKPCCLVVL